MQMLKDRHYLIADEQLNLTLDQLKNKFKNSTTVAEGAANLSCECMNNIYKKRKVDPVTG